MINKYSFNSSSSSFCFEASSEVVKKDRSIIVAKYCFKKSSEGCDKDVMYEYTKIVFIENSDYVKPYMRILPCKLTPFVGSSINITFGQPSKDNPIKSNLSILNDYLKRYH